jgi:hypothetical protein
MVLGPVGVLEILRTLGWIRFRLFINRTTLPRLILVLVGLLQTVKRVIRLIIGSQIFYGSRSIFCLF